MNDNSEALLTSESVSSIQKKSTFFTRVRKIIVIFTSCVAGAAAVFILINTFLFAIQAFQFGRAQDLKIEVFEKLFILICKFAMLLMFTSSLIMGSLIPLALMYIIMMPEKGKNE